ncbi:hypothetical protein RQP46_004733 [Phenoliferia psychrophenolica]
MLDSSGATPCQPRIATLAPELIDEILHHLVVALAQPGFTPASHPGPKSLGPYALISQIWRGPVQRRLMRRFVIKSSAQAERVVEGLVASGLHFYVKDLSIEFLCGERENIIEGPSPDDSTIWRARHLALLPTSDRVVVVLPLFIAVTSLRLQISISSHFESFELPLLNPEFALALIEVGLLSIPTLAQVTELGWFDYESDTGSALPLLKLMGPTLKTLHYETYNGSHDFLPELQQCTMVEHLTLGLYNVCATNKILQHLPSTTHTLAFTDIHIARDVLVGVAPVPAALKRIVMSEVWCDASGLAGNFEGCRDQLEDVVQACKWEGLELIAHDDFVRKAIEEMG